MAAKDPRASRLQRSPRPRSRCQRRPVSWRNLERRIRQFTEHLWLVERLDARRRQLESAGLIEANRIFDIELPLRHVFVVRVQPVESALDKRGPDKAVVGLILAARGDLRVAPKPG